MSTEEMAINRNKEMRTKGDCDVIGLEASIINYLSSTNAEQR